MRKVTIAEISAHTGLSRGTVSRAMNNRREISAATRQRVLQACADLNYVPSQTARSLATGRHYSVLVVVDALGSHASGAFLRGVLRRAEAEHYAVMVTELALNDAGRARLELVSYERNDALLFAMPAPADWAPLLAALERRVVVLPAELDGFSSDTCAPDLAAAGRLAADLLMRAEAPGLFIGELRRPLTEGLRTGLEAALRLAGTEPVDVLDTSGRALRELLSDGSLPAAVERARMVVCESDETAQELMLLCPQLGRVAGGDLAIIGFGDEPRSARCSPTLSSIDPCLEEVGSRAMSAALERLSEDTPGPVTALRVEPRLRQRESTALLMPSEA